MAYKEKKSAIRAWHLKTFDYLCTLNLESF